MDQYHGVTVQDPYRWLEYESPERDEWIGAQRELAQELGATQKAIDEIVEKFHDYIPDVWDSVPYKRQGRRFFNRSIKGQNFRQILELQANGSERLILDPNEWSDDGTNAPNTINISPKGTYISYALSPDDNDQQHWHICDVNSLGELDDTLPVTRTAALRWLEDESGFFYARTSDDGQRSVYFHKIGTKKETDEVFFAPESEDKTWYGAGVSHDNTWLYVYGSHNDGTQSVVMRNLKEGDGEYIELFEPDIESTHTYPVHNDDNRHILITEIDSPKRRIVSCSLENKQFIDIVPEGSDQIVSADVVDNRIITEYYDGTKQYIKIFELDGAHVKTILPSDEIGMVSFSSSRYDDPELKLQFESPVSPNTTYSYNVRTDQMDFLKSAKFDVDTSNYEVTLQYATSSDGTQVPMFVSKPKGSQNSTPIPTIIYGYGGFGIGMKPEFNPTILPWLETGGAYAVACIRGGDEFGKDWHDAAKKHGKQRVFDDFIACAEELIENGTTSSDMLVMQGGSNGGLLVGAVLLQKPGLARAAMLSGSLLDMLRFDKDEHAITGRHWSKEYGSTDIYEEFINLLNYSPVHNVRPAEYPIVYAAVGENDDRVLPSHTYKFIAALQAAQLGANPIIMDIEAKRGHGTSGIERAYRQIAQQYGFLSKVFSIKIPS